MTKGVLFHQDNATAHKSVVAMAAVYDCGFGLVDHPPHSPDLAPSVYFLFPYRQKTLGWEAALNRRMLSYLQLRTISMIRMRALQHCTATPMEAVCGPQWRLCWKINHINQNRPLHHSQPMNFSAHPSY